MTHKLSLMEWLIAVSIMDSYWPMLKLFTFDYPLLSIIMSLNFLFFLQKKTLLPQIILNLLEELPLCIELSYINSKNFGLNVSWNGVSWKKGSFDILYKASFSHHDWKHLLGNMVAVYLHGTFLLSDTGPFKKISTFIFTIIYCLSGIGCAWLQTKMKPNADALGASGCIFGLYGAIRLIRGDTPLEFISTMTIITGFTLGVNFCIEKYKLASVKFAAYGHLGGALTGYFTMMLLEHLPFSI